MSGCSYDNYHIVSSFPMNGDCCWEKSLSHTHDTHTSIMHWHSLYMCVPLAVVTPWPLIAAPFPLHIRQPSSRPLTGVSRFVYRRTTYNVSMRYDFANNLECASISIQRVMVPVAPLSDPYRSCSATIRDANAHTYGHMYDMLIIYAVYDAKCVCAGNNRQMVLFSI